MKNGLRGFKMKVEKILMRCKGTVLLNIIGNDKMLSMDANGSWTYDNN